MRRLILSLTITNLFIAYNLGAIRPLSKIEQFMFGEFRMPNDPPKEAPVPARLEKMPRDRTPLPAGVWLRFQNFGGDTFAGWSAKMQIDDKGNLDVVTHLGDESKTQPVRRTESRQKLDQPVLEDVRKKAFKFATGPHYRGHEGLKYAPVFVLTLKIGGKDHEFIFEAFENDFVQHLRRISHFAYMTPLKHLNSKHKTSATKEVSCHVQILKTLDAQIFRGPPYLVQTLERDPEHAELIRNESHGDHHLACTYKVLLNRRLYQYKGEFSNTLLQLKKENCDTEKLKKDVVNEITGFTSQCKHPLAQPQWGYPLKPMEN